MKTPVRGRSARPARFLAAALAAALIAGALGLAARQADRQLRAQLLQQTRVTAAALNSRHLSQLTGSAADLATPDYHHLKEQLAAIRAAQPKCRFIYLMARRPAGKVVFLLDAEPASSADYSPPGQVYEEASALLLSVFETGQAAVEGPVTDRWGAWVSPLVPLAGTAAGGEPILLGMDIDARNWRASVALHAAWPAGLAGVAILLALLAGRLYRSQRELRRQQAELRASEESYRAQFVDNSSVMLLIDPADGAVLDANEAAAAFYGYPRERLRTLHVTDLNPMPPEEIQKIIAGVPVRGGRRFETCHRRADGTLRDVEVSASRIRLGARSLIHAIVHDITERRQAVAALDTTERKLSVLFESMTEMAVLHELVFDAAGQPVNYRLLDCNPAFTRITGIPKKAAVGRLATEVYGTSAAPYLAEFARAGQLGQTHYFETHFAPMDKHFRISAVPLGANQFATIATDITERQRTEEQMRALLAESNRARQALLGILEDQTRAEADLKRLATAIEQAEEAIMVTDAQAVIQYVNPAFEKVTGYSRAEARGQNPRILQSGRHEPAFYRALRDTLQAGRTWHGRFINRRKDGSLYTEEASISPVCDDTGRITNYVAVKRNITDELRLAEQLQQAQKLESVGRLAGGVAHDFNNILTVILGRAEIALDQLDPAQPIHADLEEIREAARRAANITRQLLAFARKQTVLPQVLNLNEILEGMLQMLRRLIGENITLTWRPKPNLWKVHADPSQIDQILVNLCVNARDAIRNTGKISIESGQAAFDDDYCATHAGFVSGEYVWVAVGDNGCGMDAETRDHLFEPFFTTKAAGAGTGLGLATVYGIVKQNNGLIHVYSEPGQGTVIKIYLPRYTGAAEEAVRPDPVPPATGHETILLVEDDPAIRETASEMLRQQGYTLLTAATPAEALQLARLNSGRIRLLLTDIVMPEMDGQTLARKLLAAYPQLKVMFMSGYTADVISFTGVEERSFHFLQKPFSRHDLTAMVREILDSAAP